MKIDTQGRDYNWTWRPTFALGVNHMKRSGFFIRWGRWVWYVW